MELRIGFAARQRLLHQHIDRDAVLGVHHDHRPTLGGGLHRLQDLTIVAVEHAGVGHEQLEAADALVLGEVLHRLQRLVVDAADDLVEAVVDAAVAVGLAMPLGKTLVHVFAVALHGHVDDRRRTAPRGRVAAGLERVAGKRSAEGQFHVRVHIDATRDDVLALGVDDAIDAFLGEVARCTERANGFAVDEHVLRDHASGRDDAAVLDQCLHVGSGRFGCG